MTERPPFFDLAGVSLLLCLMAGSAIGGAIGLGFGEDLMFLVTAIGVIIGLLIGLLGERRAARRRAASTNGDPS
jgi:hypothetical protein